MKAKIYITYKEGILDPEGTTVNKALDSMGMKNIESLFYFPILYQKKT